MHVLVTNFNGNPNLGLYGLATDKYLLIGHDTPKKLDKELKKVFKVPIHRISIAGTSLIGVFLTANKHALLIPSITFDHEKAKLDKLKIKYKTIKTKHTCLGNNILTTDKVAIINPEFPEAESKEISKLLKVKTKKMRFDEIVTPGSIGILKKDRGLFHRDLEEKDIKTIEKTLSIEVETGTVNMGNPYIKSGIINNKHGFIIGDSSGGPEIINADKSLGYLK
jgi:translation initiation factor 6